METKTKIALSAVAIILSLCLITIGVMAAINADQYLDIHGTITTSSISKPITDVNISIKSDKNLDYLELVPVDGVIEHIYFEINEENPFVVFKFVYMFSETTETIITLDLGEEAYKHFEVSYAAGDDGFNNFTYEEFIFTATIILDEETALVNEEGFEQSIYVKISAKSFEDAAVPFIMQLY